MHFHIVTPCLNPDASLHRTLSSVTSQNALDGGNHRITYRIQFPADAREFSFNEQPRGNLHISSERFADRGLYDAVVRGLETEPDADAYAYLGAGDCLAPHALEIVAQTMQDGAAWVTGMICGYNDRGHLVEARLPFRYRRRLIMAGLYGRCLPFVQQESTFWNGRLHRLVDWQQVRRLRVAGDAMIWRSLVEHADLEVVEAWLGGFERRSGQLSATRSSEYRQELRRISRVPRIGDWALAGIDWVIWHGPRRLKRALDPTRWIYDEGLGRYRRP